MLYLRKLGAGMVLEINKRPEDTFIWVDRLREGILRIQYQDKDRNILPQIFPEAIKKNREPTGIWTAYFSMSDEDWEYTKKLLRERGVLGASVVTSGKTYIIR